MKSILNADLSQEGFTDGVKDGKNGNQRDAFPFKLIKNWRVWVYGNGATHSYIKAYNIGYIDGLRIKHDVYNNPNQNQRIDTNMSRDNYENHLRMLEGFQKKLLELKQQTTNIRDKYAKQLLVMENAGFVQNITKPLQEKYTLFNSKIKHLETLIDEHNHKIKKIKDELMKLIQIGRGN
jgi:hypothetical protein